MLGTSPAGPVGHNLSFTLQQHDKYQDNSKHKLANI